MSLLSYDIITNMCCSMLQVLCNVITRTYALINNYVTIVSSRSPCHRKLIVGVSSIHTTYHRS